MTEMIEEAGIAPEKMGAPRLGQASFAMLTRALGRGFSDMRRAPLYGIIVSAVYVLGGWALFWITRATGQSYWLIFAAMGFPLIGPFAAVALYEVSRRLQEGEALNMGEVFGVMMAQRGRQLPWISAVIIVIFLFWVFLAHMIFALFFGLSVMTNVSSSLQIFFSAEGLMMLLIGGIVGAAFALVLYNITVVSLPMVLDREVDFVTAMITSFQAVLASVVPMLAWAMFIALSMLIALLPGFLGLFLVLPLFGHATWHLYRLLAEEGAQD